MVLVTRAELAERLRRPLRRELADGCQDRVVAGGLERLLENLAGPFPEVRRLLEGYRELPLEERVKRLEAALALLGDTAPPTRPAPAKPQPAPETVGLETPVEALPLGPGGKKKLAALGVRTVRTMVHLDDRRYEDRRALPGFRLLSDGEKVTVAGRVLRKELVRTPKKGMQLVQAVLEDRWGWKLTAVWFNQPWVMKQLKEGARIIATGRVQRRGRYTTLAVEYFEDEEGESLSTGRITPVYPSKEGISQAFLRRSVWRALEALPQPPDPLPEAYRAPRDLVDLPYALRQVHFPDDEAALERALARLRFDEYLFLELRVMLQSGESALVGRVFEVREADLRAFKESLPFPLTGAQERAIREITADMASDRQMARLLQGDVGSGKTVVAAAALFVAARNGAQGALMAPTEILAKQHFQNLSRYLWPLGVRVELLVGAMSAAEKREVLRRVQEGEVDVVVGTHALIQEGVEFKDLGLAVIDEEHRFGVLQRRALLKGRPDVLVMSATPIPRSLALTLYGDLEVSVLDEMPPGRKPVRTKLLPAKLRRQAYAFARQEVKKGHQVFVITPMIEESEAMAELQAATRLADELRALLPDVRIEILHGRMSAAEKDAVMERFRRQEFDLLVSTTVIEVGVDIPNATLMVIENAERFGLAQLHQLRGRVGRGDREAYCILIAGDTSKRTMKRLKVIEESTDGFYIAEKDLELRGPGELRGTRQSGLPDLKLGDLTKDTELIEAARSLAKEILARDPYLNAPEHAALKRELQLRAEAIGFREVI